MRPPLPAAPIAAMVPVTLAVSPATTETLPPPAPLALTLLPTASVTSPDALSTMRPSAVCTTEFAVMTPLFLTRPA